MSLNPAHGEVHSIQYYVIKFVSDLQQVAFYPGTSVSSTNKPDRQDITEILLKVALNTITLILESKFVFHGLLAMNSQHDFQTILII